MARRRGERTVFLPWERRGGVLRRFGFSRIRYWLAFLVSVFLLIAIGARVRRGAEVRSTRATLLVTRRAIDDYRADHDGQCPKGSFEELVATGYLAHVPADAWGRPLRLACPSRREGQAFDLLSDGPDGEPWGLDRIE